MLRTQTENDDRHSAGQLILPSGQVVVIPSRGLRIGRMADNDLVLDDLKVSRHHAVIVDTGIGFAVSDLRSTNRVSVANVRVVESRLLQHDDVLRIGCTGVVFQIAE